MREILFKAKREDNGEWVYGDILHDYNNEPRAIRDYCGSNPIVPETVCQYTELVDKNGKKIFEGDIISYFTTKGIADEKCSVGEIEFSDGAFSVKHGRLWRFLCFDNYKIEVVGNIFDNPELMGCEV